jgi:hypothetical protein
MQQVVGDKELCEEPHEIDRYYNVEEHHTKSGSSHDAEFDDYVISS